MQRLTCLQFPFGHSASGDFDNHERSGSHLARAKAKAVSKSLAFQAHNTGRALGYLVADVGLWQHYVGVEGVWILIFRDR